MQINFEELKKEWAIGEIRDLIAQKLREGEAVVEFRKVDGSIRSMPCTLSDKLLPQRDTVRSSTKPNNLSVLSVWCTDKHEWRSFRVENVISLITGD